ncbi:MAG TPA: hypothetical protein VIF81_01860 [Pyrinomonadaceae bacterium]
MIIPPYGGELVDLFVTRERHAELCARATGLPRVFAWKREMPTEESTTFQRIAGDLLRELGYEV